MNFDHPSMFCPVSEQSAVCLFGDKLNHNCLWGKSENPEYRQVIGSVNVLNHPGAFKFQFL